MSVVDAVGRGFPARATRRVRVPTRALMVIAISLTVVDGLATLLWLHLGHAEANPLLATLIGHVGASLAMFVRIAVGVALLIALGAAVQRSRLAPYGLVGVTGVLLGVNLWHAAGAAMIVTG